MSDETLHVVALGGNAILPQEGTGTIEEQFERTRESMKQVGAMVEDGMRVLLVHGNGPIVGNIVIRNEAVRDRIPPMPLDICGADSQGGIGYMIQQTLDNELRRRSIDRRVVTVVTQIVVHEDDPAFGNPTKPIGPYYSAQEAERLSQEKGWFIDQDSNRGLRRMVPSPRPVEVVELEVIRFLLDNGFIVVAAGGGGVPVVRRAQFLAGIEAVIDKDHAASLLASSLGRSRLYILTDVEHVFLNYGSRAETRLEEMTASECRRYLAEGQFPPGSMGPKIEAVADFVESGGDGAVISHVFTLERAARGETGTRITADR